MINRVVLVGRLTRDPELRPTNTGTPVCTFTVACDNRGKNPDGTKSASFIPCVAFSQSADFAVKYAKKGNMVGIEGRLNQRSYDRKDGSKATVLEVLCDNIQLLEPKSNNGEDGVETPSFDDIPTSDSKNLDTIDLPDDDLPF